MMTRTLLAYMAGFSLRPGRFPGLSSHGTAVNLRSGRPTVNRRSQALLRGKVGGCDPDGPTGRTGCVARQGARRDRGLGNRHQGDPTCCTELEPAYRCWCSRRSWRRPPLRRSSTGASTKGPRPRHHVQQSRHQRLHQAADGPVRGGDRDHRPPRADGRYPDAEKAGHHPGRQRLRAWISSRCRWTIVASH